jgi:hypothetical protein
MNYSTLLPSKRIPLLVMALFFFVLPLCFFDPQFSSSNPTSLILGKSVVAIKKIIFRSRSYSLILDKSLSRICHVTPC